jgi:hypothetical protein
MQALMKDSWRKPLFCDTIVSPGVQPSRSAGRPRGVIMRLLQFGTLAIAAALAGCANYGEPAISRSSRPLVQAPQPAQLPKPALKPAPEPGSTTPGPAAQPPAPQASPAEAGAQTTTQASPESQPSAESQASPQSQPSQTANQPASAPTAAAPAPAVPEPAQLVGLSQADAGKIFGPPVERSDSPPSQIWTYRSDICDLKLYFYPEVGGSAYRALTYQIDDRGSNDATHHTCLTSLAKPRDG